MWMLISLWLMVTFVVGALACLVLLLRTLRMRTAAHRAEILLRSRREEELEREKQFVDQIIESLPILFYVHDGRKFLRWNSAFEKSLGLSAQELASMNPLDLIHPEDRAILLDKRRELLELGETRLECRLLSAGGPRYHAITGRRIELDGAVYTVGTATDLMEQKLAEKALGESERRFSDMLENVRLIAITFDVEDRLTFCNDCLLELTGWQRSEVLGRNWFEMFYPDPELSRKTFHEAFEGGAVSLHREQNILTHQGGTRLISWNSTVLRSPQGEVVGTACIGEDITDQKQYQYALQHITFGVSADTGTAFFQALASHLAQALQVELVIIGELQPDADTVSTVAVAANGGIVDNFSYRLKGTPSEIAVERELYIVETGVNRLFPEIRLRTRMEIDSFAGVLLCHASGEKLGLLSVLSTKPLVNKDLVEAMLRIFAVRATAEMVRTHAEGALKKSEEKYRLLFDKMLNGYVLGEVICDGSGRPVDYRFLEVNSSYETLTGFSRRDLIGKRVRELMPWMEDIWIERLGAVAWGGAPDEFESYAEGLKRWLKAAAYSPRPGQFAVTFTDINKRKLAEQALRESEEHVRQIFNQNDDGVMLFKMDTFEIIDANPAALEMYGIGREELKRAKPWTFINPRHFKRLINAIPRDNSLNGFQLDRATNYRKDGSKFQVSIRCKVLTLSNEYVILCSVRDITEKCRLEDEMKSTQAKLIQTNKMTSLGMLVSGIAHEINNPNNFISVNSQLLCDAWRDAVPLLRECRDARGEFTLGGLPFSEMEGEVVPRLFAGIAEGSERITRIVTNMRNFVRKDYQEADAAFDINRTIEDAASLLWHHIHRHTDSYRMDLQEDLPPARGNAQQVGQVIINLIMNALQALPGKERGVRVRSGLDGEAGCIVVSVIDEGCGMGARVRKHLTEPFFSTRIDEGGTGLGLYISSSIIKEHRGSLTFESAPGKGTTATIRLPLDAAAPELCPAG